MAPRIGRGRWSFTPDGAAGVLRLAVAALVLVVLARQGWSVADGIPAVLMLMEVGVRWWGLRVPRSGTASPLTTAVCNALNSLAVAGILALTGGILSPLRPLVALTMAIYVFQLGGRAATAQCLFLLAAAVAGDLLFGGRAHLEEVVLAGVLDLAILGTLLAWDQKVADARARVLHVVAHELRNPQASVQAAGALLARQLELAGLPDGCPARRTSAILERQAARLSRLLDQALEALRWYDRDVSLRRVPVDLRELLEAAADGRRPAWPEAPPVEVFWDPPAAPAWVNGDPAQLQRALDILLTNAVRFSSGEVVRVRCRTVGRWVTMAVSDVGVGILPSELGAIFEPFVRGSNLAGRDPGGLGLGLYVSRCIVQSHHGRLWAESREGGTTFHLVLPSRGAAEGPAPRALGRAKQGPAAADGPGCRDAREWRVQ